MKVKLAPEATLPSYAKHGDAGMDLSAMSDAVVPVGSFTLVRTGVHVQIPENHYGALVGRSGLASKGIFAHYGTIDSGYRGALGVILFNLGSTPFEIKAGDRVAQLIIQPCERVGLDVVWELDETGRGESGFGSTGV